MNQLQSVALSLLIAVGLADFVPSGGWGGAAQFLDNGGDGYSHFRICEGGIATFDCRPPASMTAELNLGGCWYGSPSTDPGYTMCPHPAKQNCDPVTGNCFAYIQAQCNGPQCSITIDNGNMGGDPCPGVYKFAGVALQCIYLPSAANGNATKIARFK
eukprot:CAMPEP_0197026412 /NCGR_PEP_ID=MMETSP1384-20130603/6502_1 /TAXON_ID=29189 /ORGANISM="Ammonia sp." /LENGTH=157 /DNA_ID=CAMNT_0042455067 /DNA_START=34 /DNA_END=507 /DNA_ORIENTATION=-